MRWNQAIRAIRALDTRQKPQILCRQMEQVLREQLGCASVRIQLGVYQNNLEADPRCLIFDLMARHCKLGQAIFRDRLQGTRVVEFDDEDRELADFLTQAVTTLLDCSILVEEVQSNFYDTVTALMEVTEKKDRTTSGHSKRVAHLSQKIALQMDLDPVQVDQIKLAALLHDIGKIGVDDRILKKAAPLDHEEWPLMKSHPELGFEIMKRVRGLRDVIAGMRFHHERWDGQGYPMRLRGDQIPLVARIIAVADAYDAIVSRRPYQEGKSHQFAMEEIISHSGSQFCPEVVRAHCAAFGYSLPADSELVKKPSNPRNHKLPRESEPVNFGANVLVR